MKFLCVNSYFILTMLVMAIGTTTVLAEAEDCPCKKERKLADQDFGLDLSPDLFSSMLSPWIVHDYFRPWRNLASLARDSGSVIKADKDKFQINLDVQHFSPEEIVVKTADGHVTIEAKHEEKRDEHGFVSRQFVRKYSLPEDAESENIVSELSSDGILTITAPRKVIDAKGERIVPITHTGPARMEAKDSPPVDNKEAKEGTCEASGQSCTNV